MSEFKNQDNDFIKRTLEIVEKYNGSYEVTLAINCSIGLLIYPKEQLSNKIEYSIVEQSLLDRVKPLNQLLTAEDFIRHLRNSLTHGHFKIMSVGGVISEINFKDYPSGNKVNGENFDITLTVNEFTTITRKIGKSILGEEI